MFTPDSRIALTTAVAPGFPALWEQMARTSFKAYRAYLGLPGAPVEFVDAYDVFDTPPVAPPTPPPRPVAAAAEPAELPFARYRDRITDLSGGYEAIPAEASPFVGARVSRGSNLMFNLADYGHAQLTDFQLAGGRIR